ncbi:MAG: 3-oxoacyl-(acyl-carrier-protein) synthase 3 [Firmicutes bacterium ADurb.Bin182]|nr:MAG: 3-oxoacyl-(acyl-carrier-protein) synthase 3 [Firmicutes bacterium ADurb.Bin182]
MRITGTGSELPKRVVTNDELMTFLDTSDEWITSRTGISKRRVLSDESLDKLAASAAAKALENAGIGANELDLMICSNVMGPYITPGLSCIVQGLIGAHCPCFDINAACAGFIYALDMAKAYLDSNKAANILIVSAEAVSHMTDWNDRATCVLFGDGAGAVVVSKGEGLRAVRLGTTSNTEVLYQKQITGNSPFELNQVKDPSLVMNGQEVYKFAVSVSAEDVKAVLEQSGIQAQDVKYFLLHQANHRILEAVRSRLHQGKEKFPVNLDRLGNTSSASIPILLDELNRQGKLSDGDILAMSAFGAGLVNGACVIQWNFK